jgi:hypothetical protein
VRSHKCCQINVCFGFNTFASFPTQLLKPLILSFCGLGTFGIGARPCKVGPQADIGRSLLMMGSRGTLKGGDEWDVLTGWRCKLKLKRWQIRAAKRAFNRRRRRETRNATRTTEVF